MDFWIVEYWSLAFTVIVSFLGGLTYFIQRQFLTKKSQILEVMNQQGRHGSASSRRKNPRNANKRKQQTTNSNSNSNDIKEEEQKENSSELTLENDVQERQSVLEQPIQQTQEKQEEEKIQNNSQIEQNVSPPTHVEDEQEPTTQVKQRNKMKPINKSPSLSSSRQEVFVPSKPQASVAPVKQAYLSSPIKNSSNHMNSSRDIYPKSNGNVSPSHNIYTYSAYNSLPPRFQQQILQKEAASAARRYRKRRGPLPSKRSSLPPGSAARSNEFIPSSFQEQQELEHEQQQIDDTQIELSMSIPQQPESLMINGYSSESDFLTDSPSTGRTNSLSPLLSTSAGSQSSLQRLDLVRSLATSHGLLDELISIFDTIAFSSEELQIILNKIATKHKTDKHDLQSLIASAKHEKTFERILDETYRSQAKILAIELQAEKSRVLELTQSNADLENIIRQFQQQQQQQPNNIAQYEQIILPYQIQLRRLADENARLQHQLHAYSMLPATINELKQQQHILNEQLRQLTIRNSALENEAAESERASKHAAEIYKKADTQKQERIEQMIADINKYKKLDKELTNFRQKYNEIDNNLNGKINEVTHQRDGLRVHCNLLKEQVEQYEQLQIKYDKLIQSKSNNSTVQIQQEINDLKAKNDELRQRNWKIMEELNKSLHEQQDNKNTKSS
ncbi:unnamed protein product [Rotaria magnacalcarata]|uniref:Uncharacterized protein n=2 Tax=Rotaria magnacalcarata TaxID=392030 RepID=A0A816UUZ5_9BILA|nr:unnamed protein product [Rotaria magnacalcarata]